MIKKIKKQRCQLITSVAKCSLIKKIHFFERKQRTYQNKNKTKDK